MEELGKLGSWSVLDLTDGGSRTVSVPRLQEVGTYGED